MRLRRATAGEGDLNDGLGAAGDGRRHAGHAHRHRQNHGDIDVGSSVVLELPGSAHVIQERLRKTMVVEARIEEDGGSTAVELRTTVMPPPMASALERATGRVSGRRGAGRVWNREGMSTTSAK